MDTREIKFRFWNPEMNKMAQGTKSLSDIAVAVYAGDCLFDKRKSFDSLTPMQFSGLTDINGKQVFEGDIIKGYESKTDGSIDEGVFKVVYDDFAFVCEHVTTGSCDTWLSFFSNNPTQSPQASCEVIGNIYENPELL